MDTRIDPSIENTVRNEWGAECFFSSFSSQKRGIMVLFKKDVAIQVKKIKTDRSGNLLQMLLNFDMQDVLLNVLYGPNHDDITFYDDVFSLEDSWQFDHSIYVGDWNLVMDFQKDTLNYQNVNNPNARNKVLGKMEQFGLVDIWRQDNASTKRYTWFKKDSTNAKKPKCSRLDFFLVSESLSPYSNGSDILPGILTDHSLIALDIDFSKFERGRGFWKFNNSLIKNTEYTDSIKNIFKRVTKQYSALDYSEDQFNLLNSIDMQNIPVTISDQLFFDTLLMEVRGFTIEYTSRKKREMNARFNELQSQVNDMNELFHLNPNSFIKERLENATIELENLNKYQAEGAAIRCKANYSVQGERATRYFCSLEKSNAACKYFSKLNVNGTIIKDQKKIEKEIFNYFNNIYTSPEENDIKIEDFLGEHINSLPKLNLKEKESCEGEITLQEIGMYLKKIRNNKSPGTDGFSGEFFKFFYPDLKYRLHKSIKQTYAENRLPFTQNLGITSLLPKTDKDRTFLKNWRPLTLLNTYYKIISGVISERMKRVLNRIIHDDQKGYLPNRYIGEAVRCTYDTIEYAKSNNLSGALLLIDFSKAFDSIKHSFIRSALRAFNFGDSFIKWVDILISDFYSVINHVGNISERFKLAVGTKQGDPISAYLFILCTEILAHKLRCAHSDLGFQFNIGSILLEMYADDLTIYLKVDENDMNGLKKNIEIILKTIEGFRGISNLSANLDKTWAVPFGNLYNKEINICNDIGIRWTRNFKLLGITLNSNLEINQEHIDSYIIGISKVLNNWRNRFLTPFGKVTVIKTLALPKITHLALVTPDLDAKYAKRLEKMFFTFIWNDKPDKVSRSDSKLPVSRGGLGMISTVEFWKALKISWIRRLTYSKSTWVTILENILTSKEYKLDDIVTYGTSILKNLSSVVTNLFWKETFTATVEMLDKITFCNPELSGLISVCGNPSIKIGNSCISRNVFQCKNNIQVADFLNGNNDFLPREAFFIRTGINLNYLNYHNIKHAIRNSFEKLRIRVQDIEIFSDPKPTLLSSIVTRSLKGCQVFYKILMSKHYMQQNLAKTEDKWHVELGRIFDIKTWDSFRSNMGGIRYHNSLKWLQLRILRRSLHTNIILSKYNHNVHELCNFCKNEPETISHIFFYCSIVQNLHSELNVFLNMVNIYLPFDCKTLLFGNPKKKAMSLDNLILLYLRGFLWRFKYSNHTPTLRCFKYYLLESVKNLKYVLEILNKSNDFEEWQPLYECLLSDDGAI